MIYICIIIKKEGKRKKNVDFESEFLNGDIDYFYSFVVEITFFPWLFYRPISLFMVSIQITIFKI